MLGHAERLGCASRERLHTGRRVAKDDDRLAHAFVQVGCRLDRRTEHADDAGEDRLDALGCQADLAESIDQTAETRTRRLRGGVDLTKAVVQRVEGRAERVLRFDPDVKVCRCHRWLLRQFRRKVQEFERDEHLTRVGVARALKRVCRKRLAQLCPVVEVHKRRVDAVRHLAQPLDELVDVNFS